MTPEEEAELHRRTMCAIAVETAVKQTDDLFRGVLEIHEVLRDRVAQLEQIAAETGTDHTARLERARQAMAWLSSAALTLKRADPATPKPPRGDGT